MRNLWFGCMALVVLLLSIDEGAALMQEVPAGKAGQPTNCTWIALSAEQLLGHRLGEVELREADLTEIFATVLGNRGVPVSYIEAEKHPSITLRLTNPTVRELLESLISKLPGYSYAFLHQHLVFYPRVPPYDSPLAEMSLPMLTRLNAASRMAKELKARYGSLAKLEPPMLAGDAQHLIYSDKIAVNKPANVLDALIQLLGNRPSVCFGLTHKRWTHFDVPEGTSYLDLFYVKVLEGLSVKPNLASVRVGDVVPLSVRAKFIAGGEQDVTSTECGTAYNSVYPERVAVDEKGVLRALAPGNAIVIVRNDEEKMAFSFKVMTAAPRSARAVTRGLPR
jgi:hypothetical protein